jgi:hypothetical protein
MSEFNASHPTTSPPLRLLERPVRSPRTPPPAEPPLLERLLRLAHRWRLGG